MKGLKLGMSSLTLLAVIILTSFDTKKDVVKVRWYSFEDAMALNEKEPKKIMIDVYTNWCSPCKIMDKKVFGDARIAEQLNNEYYPIKLNAEGREDIFYNGKTYKFVKKGRAGYHELAAEILEGRMAYPTVVFMDEKMGLINKLSGVQPTDLFHTYVNYISENAYKDQEWFAYSGQ